MGLFLVDMVLFFFLIGCGRKAVHGDPVGPNFTEYRKLNTATLPDLNGKSFYIVVANYMCTPFVPDATPMKSYADKISVNSDSITHFGSLCNDAPEILAPADVEISQDNQKLRFKGMVYTYSSNTPSL